MGKGKEHCVWRADDSLVLLGPPPLWITKCFVHATRHVRALKTSVSLYYTGFTILHDDDTVDRPCTAHSQVHSLTARFRLNLGQPLRVIHRYA
jgi:hypothetical protein